MKNITFLGASGEVTGSSYILTGADANSSQIMVDFGMFQGTKEINDLNYEPLSFEASKITAVLLTHAHLDHCGRLPLLAFTGFKGKIYMTAPTLSLVEIILIDSAKIAKESLDHAPLYGPDEVAKILAMVEVVSYDTQIIDGNFTFVFRDAGHILGSASIEIQDNTSKKIAVFSGDLGNSPEDIVRPTTYIKKADIVVMEATYGDKNHPVEDAKQILQEEINEVEKNAGVLLIPAFSLERTQEILHRIHHLKKEGKVNANTPVFLDSPMAIHATTVFGSFREFYNEELRTHTDDPFSFEGLVVTQEARDSKEIIKAINPKVIIAGSGMLSGGRILHHALTYLPKNTTRILFVGYQAEETIGRKVLGGVKNVVINDTQITVKAKIREIQTLSSHADQKKLLVWLDHIEGVKQVFITHGDTTQREVFAQKVKEKGKIKDVQLPLNGETKTLL